MTQLIRAGVVPVCGGAKLFSGGLAPFDIVLDEGWTREGVRAFVFQAPTVATSPRIKISPVEAGVAYDIAINVTEISGDPLPFVHIRLGGTPDVDGFSTPGQRVYQKVIANAGNNLFEIICGGGANTGTGRIVVKSLYINKSG